MTQSAVMEPQIEKKAPGPGCLTEAGWFFSGAVLPMGSITFYRKAAGRSVAGALVFFVLFTLVITTLSTLALGIGMFSAVPGIREAYDNGEIPDITISQGIAEVEGPQPFIFTDASNPGLEGTIVAVDTTGQIVEIDRSRYYQGFLLTRTELHMLDNNGRYQVIPLQDLNTAFETDPIVINADTASRGWATFSVFMVIFLFIFLVLWNTVVRLMILATWALVAWGIISLMRPNTGFGPIIITALYAVIPAIYITHLFSRVGFTFPGLQTFFFLIFWVIGMMACLGALNVLPEDQPLRSWTALIGLPMLLVYMVDTAWPIPAPYGSITLWVVTFLTVFVLVGVRLFLRFKGSNPESPSQTPA
jgi:hypothetical protein